MNGATYHSAGSRAKLIAIYAGLIGVNVAAWIWAIIAFADHPVLLGTALLAYSFGLRHAVDADHIAAIDNVTRKLMQDGQHPVMAGLYFSLGHSTVVVLASIVVALGATALSGLETFGEVGGVIGTTVSALFLFAIAIANIFILVAVYKTFQRVKRGEPFRRGRPQHPAGQSRPAGPAVPAAVPLHPRELADVSAGLPVRPRLRHRDRDRRARDFGVASRAGTCRSGRC